MYEKFRLHYAKDSLPKIGSKYYLNNRKCWVEVESLDTVNELATVIRLATYSSWSGNEKGTPEDRTLCMTRVSSRDRTCISHQCMHKRCYGEDKLYCKSHARKMSQ